jgi:hypothetical protein
MIAIDDPENESGKQSTVGMVGKRGALIDLVAHSTAHPGAKDILDVLTDGLMLGVILKAENGKEKASKAEKTDDK